MSLHKMAIEGHLRSNNQVVLGLSVCSSIPIISVIVRLMSKMC